MKSDPVFHVSLLELAIEDPYLGQILTPPYPVVFNKEKQYEVEEVLNSRIHWNRSEYLVKCRQYPQQDWRSAQDINGYAVNNEFPNYTQITCDH